MNEVGCLVGHAELILAKLEVSVLLVDIPEVAKKMQEAQCFVLQAIIEGCIDVSGTCTLHLSCGT